VHLVIHPDKCTGCGDCVKACVEHHGTARIGVKPGKEEGTKQPAVCRQCAAPACARACTYELIERDRTTGAMTVDVDNCQACHSCVRACPFGSVFIDPADDTALICDLCKGEPACAAVCKSQALESRA